MIWFSAQAYSFAKEPGLPREWEDSVACSVRSGRFAIADGATQAYRSGEWAEMLTEAYVTDFPPRDGHDDPQRMKAIRDWFADQARMWQEREVPASDWWAKDAAQANPPSATFAGLQVTRSAEVADWEAVAIGDCCLFQIRQGHLMTAFPLDSPAQFNTHPHLLTTANGRLTGSLNALRARTGRALPGDIFVLGTDAVSECLLGLAGHDPDIWGRLGFFGARKFGHMVADLRAAEAIAADDVAILVIAVHSETNKGAS